MSMDRRQFVASLGLGVTAGVAGCAEDGGTADSVDQQNAYDTAGGSAFTTLNPIYNTESGAGTAIGRALDQGYTFTPDEELFPLLYDVRMVDDDQSVWVVELQDGLVQRSLWGGYRRVPGLPDPTPPPDGVGCHTKCPGLAGGCRLGDRTPRVAGRTHGSDPLWPKSFDPLEYAIPIDILEPYVDNEDTT